jgi:uncharacterized protein YcaQ
MTRIPLDRARQLAVMGQLLDADRPAGVVETATHLGGLQLDPTAAVARNERLLLFSRLGPYDAAELENALWRDRTLFEHWAYIVPTAHFAVHRETQKRFPRGEAKWVAWIREWLAANASFRRYVLRELRERGPLRSRDLEDRSVVPYSRSGGWNLDKNVGRMLEFLWLGGEIATVGRDRGERVWDLAERVYPLKERQPPRGEWLRDLVLRQARARGIAKERELGSVFDGPVPGREKAIAALVRAGRLVEVDVERLGKRLVDAELLERPFRGRTAILSPFDKLVADRTRAERLWDFEFRLEIYVPKEKRRWGYFVLPVLHEEKLVARLDAAADRDAGVLRIHATHVEPAATPDALEAMQVELGSLAGWLGLAGVATTGRRRASRS